MRRLLLIGLLGLILPLTSSGQIWTVQTNVLDWAALGTVNAEVGVSLSQHFSLMAGGRLNPWEFKDSKHDILVYNQQKTVYLGVRYWPWYVNSGLWFSAKAQYTPSFAVSGLWSKALTEGKNGFGGVLSAGYTFMLSKHFNLEAGIGAWAGVFQDYSAYNSQANKNYVREEGRKTCILPDQVSLSLVYVF